MSHWQPSIEQEEIRDQILACLDRGFVLISEWVSTVPDLTWEMWESWWTDKKFRAWWCEQVPAHHGVSDADLRMVESLAMRTLARGLMESGKDRASLIAAWHRINEARTASDEHGLSGGDDEEWLDYISGHPEAKWLNGGESAEA